MMSYLRSTEGFTKDEVAEFKEVYDHFDRDGSGEVSVLELGPILLELGYPTSIDLQQRYIAEVDVDGSGEMDIGELLKVLRKYRNRELMQTEQAFHMYGRAPKQIQDELAEDAEEAAAAEEAEKSGGPQSAPRAEKKRTSNVMSLLEAQKAMEDADIDDVMEKSVPRAVLLEVLTSIGWDPPKKMME